jgi:hypothetical protein
MTSKRTACLSIALSAVLCSPVGANAEPTKPVEMTGVCTPSKQTSKQVPKGGPNNAIVVTCVVTFVEPRGIDRQDGPFIFVRVSPMRISRDGRQISFPAEIRQQN